MDHHDGALEQRSTNTPSRRRSSSFPHHISTEIEMNPPKADMNSTEVPIPKSPVLSNRHKKYLADYARLKADGPMVLKNKSKEMLNRDWARRLSAGTFAIDGLLRSKHAYRLEDSNEPGMQTVTFLMGPRASVQKGDENTPTTGTTSTSGQLTGDILNGRAQSSSFETESDVHLPTTPVGDVLAPHTTNSEPSPGLANNTADMAYHQGYHGQPHQGNNGNQHFGGQFYNPQGMQLVRWGPPPPPPRQVYSGFQVHGQSVERPVYGPQNPQQFHPAPQQDAQFHAMANVAQQQYMNSHGPPQQENSYGAPQQDYFNDPHHPPVEQQEHLTVARNMNYGAYQVLQHEESENSDEDKRQEFQTALEQDLQQTLQDPQPPASPEPQDEEGFESQPIAVLPPAPAKYGPPLLLYEPLQKDPVPEPPTEDFTGIYNPLTREWMSTDFNVKKPANKDQRPDFVKTREGVEVKKPGFTQADFKLPPGFNLEDKSASYGFPFNKYSEKFEFPLPETEKSELPHPEKESKESKARRQFHENYPGLPRDPIWGTASGLAPPKANWNERNTRYHKDREDYVSTAVRNANKMRQQLARKEEKTGDGFKRLRSEDLNNEYEQLVGPLGFNPFDFERGTFTNENGEVEVLDTRKEKQCRLLDGYRKDIEARHAASEFHDVADPDPDDEVEQEDIGHGRFSFAPKTKPHLKLHTTFSPAYPPYTEAQAAEDTRLAQLAADSKAVTVTAAYKRESAAFVMGFGAKSCFRTVSRLRFDTFGKMEDIFAQRHKGDPDIWCEGAARRPRMGEFEVSEEGRRMAEEMRCPKKPLGGLGMRDGRLSFANAPKH